MTTLVQAQVGHAAKPVIMAAHSNLLQRKCACGGTPGPSGECGQCRQKRLGRVQRSAVGTQSPDTAPETVHEVLRSPGRPLDAATRAFFEPRFGHDFSQVRVHTDARAAESARRINALAYTVGLDVVFGAGRYAPNTTAGSKLLAHELTHVLQQNGSASLPQCSEQISRPGDPSELEAESVAERLATGLAAPTIAPLTAVAIQRAPDSATEPGPADKAAKDKATALETEILDDPGYKKLPWESKIRVKKIIRIAKTKPPGDAPGQRNYYLTKLKIAITTPFEGTETGKTKYGCSEKTKKKNQAAVEQALEAEKKFWEGSGFEDVEEKTVASGTKKVPRIGRGRKKFYVDRSDPRNIRVQMKVKLNGKPEEVASIKKLEDAIERKSLTSGYTLDIVFVNASGPDVFEFTVIFCEWANAANLAAGPTTLSHEVHHALGLKDRYDYIEAHAANREMSVRMRLVWFLEQMNKTAGARDPYSKMHTSSKPLLAEDVCAVAFAAGPERKKCIEARKDLDAPGLPQP